MIRLRPAAAQDALQLLRWRNDPGIYKRCLDARPVRQDEHRRWFQARLQDPATRIYILQAPGVRAAGQGRIDLGPKAAEISLALGPQCRGKGLGTAAVQALSRQAFRLGARKIIAHVKKDNPASVIVFIKAGYRFARCARVKAQEVYLLEKAR